MGAGLLDQGLLPSPVWALALAPFLGTRSHLPLLHVTDEEGKGLGYSQGLRKETQAQKALPPPCSVAGPFREVNQ